MRFAGFCFIAIAFLFMIEFFMIVKYFETAKNSIQSFSIPEKPDKLLETISLLGVFQLIFLVLAGGGMINHNAMDEDDAKEKLSDIENRIKKIEKDYDTDKSATV